MRVNSSIVVAAIATYLALAELTGAVLASGDERKDCSVSPFSGRSMARFRQAH